MTDGGAGISFFNKGLPEYEAGCKGKTSYYYLTLLRAIGWISRGDLNTRRMGAGPTIAAPGGQCLDTYDTYYSFTTHAKGWKESNVARHAMEFCVPVFSTAYENRFRTPALKNQLPEHYSLLSITPDDSPVLISAIKKAEERNSIIVRLFNPSTRKQKVTITTGKDFKRVYSVRLDETREQTITDKKQNTLKHTIPAHKIITLEFVV